MKRIDQVYGKDWLGLWKGFTRFMERIDQVYGKDWLGLWKGLIRLMERIDQVYGTDQYQVLRKRLNQKI